MERKNLNKISREELMQEHNRLEICKFHLLEKAKNLIMKNYNLDDKEVMETGFEIIEVERDIKQIVDVVKFEPILN